MALELPTGTVTLLFTDIEGSTRMLQELGREAYVRALTDHRRLLREAFRAHGGVEVEMQGDSFHFAFPYARDAVAAAVAGQRALLTYEWESQPIAVRIGLHTGEPVQADGLYAGLDVHRAARVMSAGHGGQVLVSQQTAELVYGELPAGISLLDLGEHRLKDLSAPQRLYQARAEGLPSTFPPLKTLTRVRTNLPVQANQLLGREQELSRAGLMLAEDVGLITFTGPGGTGKTRLALQVAADAAEHSPDGALWVSLAAVADPEQVLPAIAQACGVAETPGESLELTLRNFLTGRRIILLLDNFEHVLEASTLVGGLLAAAPGLRILVTSRERLHLSVEHEFEVRPLAMDDARALFESRARQLQADPGAAESVSEICLRLDGLPLAIELAAALTKLLTPEQILERLENRFEVLTGGPRDLPTRQQTLRATMQWSYELLEPAEQVLFERLSAFAGSFDLAAAEAVANASVETLGALVDKSLLRRTSDGRLFLLETIRAFAAECRSDDSVLTDHARYYAAIGREAGASYFRSGSREAAAVLERELSNLRAAASCDPSSEVSVIAAAAFGAFALARASYGDARIVIERALAFPRGQRDPQLLLRAAQLALAQGRYDDAQALSKDALEAACAETDDISTAEVLSFRGWLYHHRDDMDESEKLAERAFAAGAAAGIDYVVAEAIGLRAGNAAQRGELRAARELAMQSLGIVQKLQHPPLIVERLMDLARLARRTGDYAQAVELGEDALVEAGDEREAQMKSLQSLALSLRLVKDYNRASLCASKSLRQAENMGSARGVAQATYALGCVECDRGNHEQARALLRKSLALAQAMGDRLGIASILEQLAFSASAEGQGERALRLFTVAERIRDEIGAPRSSPSAAQVEQLLHPVRHSLGSAFDNLWTDACRQSPDEIIREETETETERPTQWTR